MVMVRGDIRNYPPHGREHTMTKGKVKAELIDVKELPSGDKDFRFSIPIRCFSS
jgi:hypothetical protein